MAAAIPIKSTIHVKRLLDYYKHRGEYRNSLLIHIGIYTGLRISDILTLRYEDVYDANRRVRKSISLTESKTGKGKSIAINKELSHALKLYQPIAKHGKPLILNAKTGKAISRVHANRLIARAATGAGIPHNVSCHSLRKTFGYTLFKANVNEAMLTGIFNHSSFSITKTYLGIDQDEKDAVYLAISFDKPSVQPNRPACCL